jgi:hypothetical protein
MARAPLPKSKRQYAHVQNGPAQRFVRTLKGAKSAPMPSYIEPLQPTEAAPPLGSGWIHEIKLRRLSVALWSRNCQREPLP